MLVGIGVIGLVAAPFAPIHLRGIEGWLDRMHIILTMGIVLFTLLAIGIGATAFGKRFRFYSIATIGSTPRLWHFGRLGRSPTCRTTAYPVAWSYGAHQYRRLPAMGAGTGRQPLASWDRATASGLGREVALDESHLETVLPNCIHQTGRNGDQRLLRGTTLCGSPWWAISPPGKDGDHGIAE